MGEFGYLLQEFIGKDVPHFYLLMHVHVIVENHVKFDSILSAPCFCDVKTVNLVML